MRTLLLVLKITTGRLLFVKPPAGCVGVGAGVEDPGGVGGVGPGGVGGVGPGGGVGEPPGRVGSPFALFFFGRRRRRGGIVREGCASSGVSVPLPSARASLCDATKIVLVVLVVVLVRVACTRLW